MGAQWEAGLTLRRGGGGGASGALEKGNGRWERLGLNGFCGLPRGGVFKGLGFGVESKLGLRLSGRLALGGMVGFCLCQP